jgi:small GTP-binding protein
MLPFCCLYVAETVYQYSHNCSDLEDLHTQILQIKDTENVPMILVGNKADLNDSRMITTETGKDTANRWNASFMEVSAKNCMGVEDCFNNVSKQIVSTLPKPKSKKTKCTIV